MDRTACVLSGERPSRAPEHPPLATIHDCDQIDDRLPRCPMPKDTYVSLSAVNGRRNLRQPRQSILTYTRSPWLTIVCCSSQVCPLRTPATK